MRLAVPMFALVTLLLPGCSLLDKGGSDEPGLLEDKDEDNDGFDYGEDCDDDNADINPDADEKCDPADVDEDCNGLADNTDDQAFGSVLAYHDGDGDGYGDVNASKYLCEVTAGYVTDATDCDDLDPRVNPGSVEVCDPLDVDEDCDGLADDADPGVDPNTQEIWYVDVDGDGYGDADTLVASCDPGTNEVDEGTDCDDRDATVNPDEAEDWYDGVDQDCSGGSDYDRDGDGYDQVEDCDDRSSLAHPGAFELWYDGIDEDCSGGSDYDQDGDGHDSAEYGGGDCDDGAADTFPGAPEDGRADTNCDGETVSTPMAVATSSGTLETCLTVTLDGSGSWDPDAGALTYEWELVTIPSTATETTDDIHEFDDVSPTFTPAVAGDYTFELVVTNAAGTDSWPETLVLPVAERTSNQRPVANAGTDQTSTVEASCTSSGYTWSCDDCEEDSFTLDATGSTDADGEPLTYSWAVTSGTATLSDSTSDKPVVTVPMVSATYGSDTTSTVVVTLTATDCYGDSTTDTVTLSSVCSGG